MNKKIKLLIENIFNDDIFDTDDGIESEIDLTHTIYKYHPKTKQELKDLIKERFKTEGNECDLNDIDTSEITDMSQMFFDTEFNGDISGWNVSNVTNMQAMFFKSEFNGDISGWDVSKVTNMISMFFKSEFNGDISLWDVSKVTNMSSMFSESGFNGDISNWDVSNVTSMHGMFKKSEFNSDISLWDVSNVTNMYEMFAYNYMFNCDISNWKLCTDKDKNVTLSFMFMNCTSFNRPIGKWDVSRVNNIYHILYNCTNFCLRLTNWDFSHEGDYRKNFSNYIDCNTQLQIYKKFGEYAGINIILFEDLFNLIYEHLDELVKEHTNKIEFEKSIYINVVNNYETYDYYIDSICIDINQYKQNCKNKIDREQFFGDLEETDTFSNFIYAEINIPDTDENEDELPDEDSLKDITNLPAEDINHIYYTIVNIFKNK